MKILTPNNAAFTPAGVSDMLELAASYDITETVNADFGPTPVVLLAPEDAFYAWAVFAYTITAAAAGNLEAVIEQPGGPISITGTGLVNLGVVGIGGGFVGGFATVPVLAQYGDVTISRQVSGLAGGPATYRITAAAYKLC